jgi:hypothetical protein
LVRKAGSDAEAVLVYSDGIEMQPSQELRMTPQKLIDTLSDQFSQLLANRPDLPGQQELQRQMRSMLHSTFAKLDLVTREEFDAQQAVLLRSRERLEQLERRLAALEPSAAETAPPPSPPAAVDSDRQT